MFVRLLKYVCFVLSLVLFAGAVAAYDFTEADRHFALREGSYQHVEAGLRAYSSAIKHVHGSDLIHAVERFSWLSYYKGDILLSPLAHQEKKKTYGQCLSVVDLISPESIGSEIEPYYFWKSTCLVLWAQATGGFWAGVKLSELHNLIEHGLALGTHYFQGGIQRIAAAVYGIEPKLRFLGLYNPEKGQSYIEEALKGSQEFYQTYTIKAYILKQRGLHQEGIVLLEQKLRELEELNSIDVEHEFGPENRYEILRMKAVLDMLRNPVSKKEEAILLFKCWEQAQQLYHRA